MTRSEHPRHSANSGFTLVELLVVIVVMGILATIALSAFLDQRRKAWDAAVESDLRQAATVQHTVLAGGDWFAATVPALEASGFHPSPGVNYSGGSFAMTVTVTGNELFCMTAHSASGRFFGISSGSGVTSSSTPVNVDTCD